VSGLARSWGFYTLVSIPGVLSSNVGHNTDHTQSLLGFQANAGIFKLGTITSLRILTYCHRQYGIANQRKMGNRDAELSFREVSCSRYDRQAACSCGPRFARSLIVPPDYERLCQASRGGNVHGCCLIHPKCNAMRIDRPLGSSSLAPQSRADDSRPRNGTDMLLRNVCTLSSG
jgi:hypothetical protein